MEKSALINKLEREQRARDEAEQLLEKKSLELYKTNEALKKLATDLTEREAKIRAILEATADSIIVFDDTGVIEISNPSSKKVFGFAPEELIGKNTGILNFYLENDRDRKGIALNQINTSNNLDNSNSLQEFYIKRKTDGKQIYVELSISKTNVVNKVYTICVIRDITDRKFIERHIATQHRISRTLVEAETMEEANLDILKIICSNLNLELGNIWIIDPISESLRCTAYFHTRETEPLQAFVEVCKKMTFKKGIGLPGRAWESKEPCWILDINLDNNFPRAAFASKAGIHTAFAFPILYHNEVIGVLEFFTRETRQEDNRLLNMLKDIGQHVGFFIERKQNQQKIISLNDQLVTAARQAGMAEVATSVLHNIGNVLNSVNVSASVICEKVSHSEMSTLSEVTNLLKAHQPELGKFITEDSQGKHLVPYLNSLSDYWNNEQKKILAETELLINNIQHIKNIVKMQQSLSGSLGMIESIKVTELIENAITINADLIEHSHILIQRYYEPVPPIMTDKVKVLQILVNLLRNALDALTLGKSESKSLTLKTFLMNPKTIAIQISDNGIGIESPNLIKIFSYGFTTKEDGHGFGLHISALAAQEMGGKLKAESEGLGKGASFTLYLPCISVDRPKK